MPNSTTHDRWVADNAAAVRKYKLKWYYANKDKVAAYRAANHKMLSRSRRRGRNKRRDIVRAAKLQPCADCGHEYPWFCMDFDHVRGTKLFNIGSAHARNFTITALIAEIAKCDVVCVMCHRWRTHAGELEH